MDRKGIGRKDRTALQRIITLLLSFADLAEATCGRSAPVRWLVLLILGFGEAVARDYVARLTGVPAFTPSTDIPVDPNAGIVNASNGDASIMGDSIARAMRLAFVFRALAAMLAALPDETAAPAAPAPHATGVLEAFRDLVAAPPVERRDSS